MKTLPCLLLALPALLLVVGCNRKEAEGYRVVGYEHPGKWVIIRTGTFNGKFLRKRMTVQCDFYKWGDHDVVQGLEACNLQVGRFMTPKASAPDPQGRYPGLLDIWEMSADRLAITEGDGPNAVSQQFIILKNEVLPD